MALGRLGSAVTRLAVDGIDTVDVPDPERAWWVNALANACSIAGQPPIAPSNVAPGRLAELADAAGMTATLYRDELTSGERWASVVALTDTVLALTRLAEGPHPTAGAARAIAMVDAAGAVVSRFAALDPPNAEHAAVLDRPVPDPFPNVGSHSARIDEAVAGLVHSTRPGTGPHSVAAILAVTIAAETLCRATARPGDGDAADVQKAAVAWSNVRSAFAPFNDGSREPQTVRPVAASYALSVNRVLHHARVQEQVDGVGSGILVVAPEVARRLPVIARHLGAAVVEATNGGRLLAHACDLPLRESRVEQFLAGRRPRGLVVADLNDVRAVTDALDAAVRHSSGLGDGRHRVDTPYAGPDLGRVDLDRVADRDAIRAEPVDRSHQERTAAATCAAATALAWHAAPPVSGPRR
ncbi:hypothetical protein ACXR2U_00990 [Jatrophihabitans sp. YIM 134969]